MNSQIGDRVRSDLQALRMRDAGAKAFFDWAANRTNDAAETSVDRISQKMQSSYAEARDLAKRLCEIGLGDFVIGRKGWKSRIRWKFSLRSLGKAAAGEDVPLERVDPLLLEEVGEQAEAASSSDTGTSMKRFTIAEAKLRLAESLGVSPDAIEIIIKA